MGNSTNFIGFHQIFGMLITLFIWIIIIKAVRNRKKVNNPTGSKTKPDPMNNYQNNKFYDLANGGIFETSIKIGDYFRYDKDNQKIMLLYSYYRTDKKKYSVYNLSDILEFEYIEDGTSQVKGGLGSALVGGALFGGVGAIVGGATGTKETKRIVKEMKIKFVIKGDIPTVDYLSVKSPSSVKSDSYQYGEYIKQLHEILGILNHATPKEELNTQESKEAAELKKFKQLLDDGLITQEEFDIKRKQILGL